MPECKTDTKITTPTPSVGTALAADKIQWLIKQTKETQGHLDASINRPPGLGINSVPLELLINALETKTALQNGADVMHLQAALTRLNGDTQTQFGADPGRIDGVYANGSQAAELRIVSSANKASWVATKGSLTQRSVLDFQKKHDLAADGIAGRETIPMIVKQLKELQAAEAACVAKTGKADPGQSNAQTNSNQPNAQEDVDWSALDAAGYLIKGAGLGLWNMVSTPFRSVENFAITAVVTGAVVGGAALVPAIGTAALIGGAAAGIYYGGMKGLEFYNKFNQSTDVLERERIQANADLVEQTFQDLGEGVTYAGTPALAALNISRIGNMARSVTGLFRRKPVTPSAPTGAAAAAEAEIVASVPKPAAAVGEVAAAEGAGANTGNIYTDRARIA